MSGRDAVLVYNPRAGRILRNKAKFDKAVEILRVQWPDIRLVETTGPKTAGPIAKACADEGATRVFVCGGDGTIHEAAQSMTGTGVPIGILPGGTANSLANEIGLGNDLVGAARALAASEPVDIATGMLRRGSESTTFMMMAGIGFDALCVHDLDLEAKDRWGKLAYWAAAVRQIGRRLASFEVHVDGKSYRSSFALVSRTRNYGGDVAIARGASILSSSFEVILFDTTSVLKLVWYFGGIVTRTLGLMRGVTVLRATRVSAAAGDETVHVQADGEYAGVIPAEIEIVPGAIRLLVPGRWLAVERARLA